jgi:anthranilate phosphoribosyltransferase
MQLKSAIEKLTKGQDLKSYEIEDILTQIFDPSLNPLQLAAFLVLLRAKPESAEELATLVKAMRNHMLTVPTHCDVLDIVGTGGDLQNTINISTGSAMLAASCGVKVAKHGNHAVSSLAGSADVIEALGIKLSLTPKHVAKCIETLGIGFCYAPNFHPMTQALRQFRKQLGVPTSFNLLGPLLNPANASHLVLGVLDEKLMPKMAEVLMQLGSKRSVIVHGNGLDEISAVGPAKVIEVSEEGIEEYVLDPLDLGFPRCSVADLRGGDALHNSNLLKDTFKGKKGPIADTLILNTAVALKIYGKYTSLQEACAHAKETLYSGQVNTLLTNWIEFSHEQ